MSERATCATCRYGKRYLHPGERPAPTRRWIGFFETDDIRTLVYDAHLARHEDSIKCRRMPEPIKKNRNDWCGEHTPAEPKEG